MLLRIPGRNQHGRYNSKKKNENLLGDGVNIAARLEAFAQHSGVCISKSIYDLVASKTVLLSMISAFRL